MFEHLSKIAAVDPTSAGWAPDELLGLVFRRTVQTSAEIFTPGNFHRRVPDYLGCSSSCAAMVRHFSAISISCCLIKGSTVCAARLSHSSLARYSSALFNTKVSASSSNTASAMIPRGSHIYYWFGRQLIYQFGPHSLDDLPHLIVTQ